MMESTTRENIFSCIIIIVVRLTDKTNNWDWDAPLRPSQLGLVDEKLIQVETRLIQSMFEALVPSLRYIRFRKQVTRVIIAKCFRMILTIFVTCDLERKQYNIYTIILSGSIIFLQGNILPCIPPLQCKACNFLGFDYLRNNYLRMISYETIPYFLLWNFAG